MKPALRIGTDEAGYGPSLGPLVVARVGLESGSIELPRGRLKRRPGAPQIDDSKRVYGRGLAALEKSALAIWTLARGRAPSGLHELVPATGAVLEAHPWYLGLELPLPVAAGSDEIRTATDALRRSLDEDGAGIVDADLSVLFEGEFNLALETRNKASVESELILRLWRAALEVRPPDAIRCDRLGGRRRYEGLLQALFPFRTVAIVEEVRERSRYEVDLPSSRVFVDFEVEGERKWPEIAMASCLAKYARELCMILFNRHFAALSPGLSATAGYPLDARRFLADISGIPGCEAILGRLVRRA